MSVPKKTINEIFNPRVIDKEKYISEDINYLKDIINKKANVIDMMSPGPLRDELRGTFDPTQESYEEYLQRQSIPQMDRPLTGQLPRDAILETQRIDLNEGGVIGPGGMFRGEDLGTRQGFKYVNVNNKQIKNIEEQIQKLRSKNPGTGFSIQIENVNDPSRSAMIRVTHQKIVDGVKTKQDVIRAPFTEEGIKQISKGLDVARKDLTKYPKTDLEKTYITKARIPFKNQRLEWTQEAIDFINEETKKPIYHNDSNAVEKIEQKLINKFSDPKYKQVPKGANRNDAFVRKSTKFGTDQIFLEQDYVFKEGSGLDGVQMKRRVSQSGPRAQKDLIAIGLLRNSGKKTKWNNLSNSITTYFNPPKDGQPKVELSGPNKNELRRFSKKFNLMGARASSSSGTTLLSNYLVKQGADFEKYKIQSVFARRTIDELENDLKRPDLSQEQKIKIQKAIDEISVYENDYKRKLSKEYPSLFKRTKGKSLVFEHLIARSIPEQTGELFQSFEKLPYEYKLKGRYVPISFNFEKLKNFDTPLLDLIDQYENAADVETRKATQTEIEKLQKNFNQKTKIKGGKGYLDNLKITFKPDQVILKDITPIVGAKPLSQQQFYMNAAEGIEYSNSYFKNTGNKKNIISGPQYDKFKLAINKIKSPTSTTGKLGALGTYGTYAVVGGAMLKPVIEGFLQDQGILEKPRGKQMASLDGQKYIPEESSFAEQAGLTALGGATILGGGLAGKKLIEKTTGRFAPMIKGAIGKTLTSPFALPFRATGLDRMAMKKLGLLPEDETYAQTYDPRTASGRTALALEGVAAGVYKPIAEGLTSGIKNQTAKNLATGILKLGPRALNVANVLSKVGRATTPLGIASLLGEGAYQLLVKPQREYLESLDPEERKNVEQQYADVAAAEGGIIRKAYKDAGLVEKLGRGASAFDPRNLPYYGAKALKGLGSGAEMAIKFPVAAGAAIGETIQKGPRKETLTKFGEAMQPSATQYLSEKTGLESLIKGQEKELLEKRPGAVTMGDVLELGAEFVAPATGYIKMLEDGGSKLYKVIRDGQAGKKVDPKDIDEVLEVLSDKGVGRRDFMAVVGGTSALALAKHIGIVDALKILEKTKPVRMLSKSASKMPEWFPNFASRILDDTNSVFKQIDEDVVEITNKNLPDVSISKHSSGRWEIQGYNEYGQPYLIDYEPPAILEGGVKYPGDFSVFDNVPSRMGPDDVEFDSELVESIDDVLGGTSKLEEWTTGVKKKELTPGEKRVVEAEGRADAEYDAWRESEWDE